MSFSRAKTETPQEKCFESRILSLLLLILLLLFLVLLLLLLFLKKRIQRSNHLKHQRRSRKANCCMLFMQKMASKRNAKKRRLASDIASFSKTFLIQLASACFHCTPWSTKMLWMLWNLPALNCAQSYSSKVRLTHRQRPRDIRTMPS